MLTARRINIINGSTSLIASLRSTGISSVTIKLINTNSSNNQVIFNSKKQHQTDQQLVINDASNRHEQIAFTKKENPVTE
jgi:hypothetical protein